MITGSTDGEFVFHGASAQNGASASGASTGPQVGISAARPEDIYTMTEARPEWYA